MRANPLKLGSLKVRLAITAALVAGFALVPASAQADPVTNDGCTVQVQAQPPLNSPQFTFNCDFNVTHVTGTTNQDALLVPPALSGDSLAQGFQCVLNEPEEGDEPLSPTSGPNNPFICSGGPSNGGMGSFATMDPCGEQSGTLFRINSITFDNRVLLPPPPPGEDPEITEEATVNNIEIQGCPEEAGTAGGGGETGGDDTGGEEGQRDDRGKDFGKGKPKGGVEAGGAAVGQPPSSSPVIGGPALLWSAPLS